MSVVAGGRGGAYEWSQGGGGGLMSGPRGVGRLLIGQELMLVYRRD